MAATLFGTDGIRGRVNSHPMTVEVAVAVGRAVGERCSAAAKSGNRPSVLIGRDTRRSGTLFESALASGLMSAGVDVVHAGILPTPAVAHLTAHTAAAAGLVITASHNPHWDNGIKVFGPDGFKLSDAEESELEKICTAPFKGLAAPDTVGTSSLLSDASARYLDFLASLVPSGFDLRGRHIALDCANGATHIVAPALFRELGAELTLLGVTPNGTNINDGVGATHPEAVSAAVAGSGADFGIAFDGDGDRVLFVDEGGSPVDGDELLAIMAVAYDDTGKLTNRTIAATVMSNIGLDVALRERGIDVIRTDVGDRYVVEAMRSGELTIGGEQSGHIVCLDKTTTGDGVVAALTVLAEMARQSAELRQLRTAMTRFPQALVNVDVRDKPAIETLDEVQACIESAEAALGNGRVLVRYSGTEPLARVMVEGMEQNDVDHWVKEIARRIEETIGAKQ